MPTHAELRVVVADDSLLLRAAIVHLLEHAGMRVVGQAGDADELLRKVRAHRPDVALVDIRMPPTHVDEGLQAARAIRAELPEVGILLLSQYVEQRFATELLEHGADGVGYVLKDRVSDIDRFIDAVRQVAARGSVLDPAVVALMVGRPRRDDPLHALGERDRDVLAQMAQGATNRAIARRMFLSERAVERHVTTIFDALGLARSKREHRRVLAVLAYLEAA
jgi:DNA-binding NarL/FixJ family response regulator